MISHELLLALKNAGFPQEGHGLNSDLLDMAGNSSVNVFRESVYDPTLSELIESCGNEFELLSLEYIKDEGFNDSRFIWWANSKNHRMAGTSIEEAVANLWLSLNKI